MSGAKQGISPIVFLVLLVTGCTGGMQTQGGSTPGGEEGTDERPLGTQTMSPGAQTLPPFEPLAPVMRRLSREEYHNSLRDVFGSQVALPGELEPDLAVNGLVAVGNTTAKVSPRGVEQYEAAALEVAHEVMADATLRQEWAGCQPQGEVDKNCASSLITRLGRRLWRRPLENDEVERWATLAGSVAQRLGDFWVGLEFALVGLLQSPHFLYRVEYGAPAAGDQPRPLDDMALATRLSFLLWASGPDEALLRAAEAGELQRPGALRAQAERMMADTRARRGMGAFWTAYLELSALQDLHKDEALFPKMSPTLPSKMRRETLQLMEHLIFESEADMREMFTTRTTFVDAELASLYGLTPPEDAEADAAGFWQVEHPEGGLRRGILGHAGLLAVTSHVAETSSTHRGRFLRQALLCQSIPDPPPGVSTEVPEPPSSDAQMTRRQRIETYLFSNVTCAACHQQMDPMGFGLEHFDALGAQRDQDNGLPIDASGELDGVPFGDARGLAQALHDHPATMDCMVRKTYRLATGRIEGRGAAPVLQGVSASFEASGWRFHELIYAIVESDGFRMTRAFDDQEIVP